MNGLKNYQIAAKFRQERKLEEALKYIDLAIEENDQNADFYSERGVIRFHLNQKQEGLKDMEKAVELEPTNAFRYSARAYLLESVGKTEAAIDDYRKAIELDPEDAVAHNNLGLLEEKLGYMKSSKQNFQKADQLAEKNNLGRTELQKGAEPSGGIDILKEDSEDENKGQKSKFDIIKKVFSDKKTRQEFVRFIKNGFKVDKKDD